MGAGYKSRGIGQGLKACIYRGIYYLPLIKENRNRTA